MVLTNLVLALIAIYLMRVATRAEYRAKVGRPYCAAKQHDLATGCKTAVIAVVLGMFFITFQEVR